GDDERRREAEGTPPGNRDQHARLLELRDERSRVELGRENESLEQADAAVPPHDARELLRQPLEAGGERRRASAHGGEQVLGLERVEHGEGRGGSQRIAAEGRAVAAR